MAEAPMRIVDVILNLVRNSRARGSDYVRRGLSSFSSMETTNFELALQLLH